MRKAQFLSMAGLTLVVSACEQSPPLYAPPPTPAIATRLTPEAAAALKPDGTFIDDAPESPDGTPMITREQAVRQTMAYIRSYGMSFYPTWKRQHGGDFNLATLAPDSRVYFAHTPYAGTPRDAHPSLRRVYGPYYIVTLKDGNVPVIVMAVSAYDTDVGIEKDGQISLAKVSGADFVHSGIPTASRLFKLLSPEEAVERASTVTGAKVAAPPKLVLLNARRMPALAAWQVTLDREVTLKDKSGGVARAERAVLLGMRDKERFLRVAVKPTARFETQRAMMGAKGQRAVVTDMKIATRDGYTTVAESVDIGPEK